MKGIEGLYVVQATEEHARQFEEHWMLYHIAKAASDTKWTWRLFEWDKIIDIFLTVAAVDTDGRLEGLIAVDNAESFLKVAFLATAPWNFGKDKLRRGIGPALLAWAIEVSRKAGHAGALTLSSTPESESFYDARGFVRTGECDDEGLAIYQLPADRVARYLSTTQGFKPFGAEAS